MRGDTRCFPMRTDRGVELGATGSSANPCADADGAAPGSADGPVAPQTSYPQREQPLVPATLSVSVVVPTFERPELLGRCLAALVAQDFDPMAYEVIVADNAAGASTRRLVEGWAERSRPAVRYVAGAHARGPAAARNAGWRAARGPIVAFTDDDCVPDPGWLGAGVAAFVDDVAGARGRIVVPLPEAPTDYERDAAGLQVAEFSTANCFYRRDALAAVGGFDERFTAAWREDSDLFFSLRERGRRLVEAPGAVVVHPVRPAPWGVSLAQQRKSLFNALLYKKHPALYRRAIRPGTPWHYYAIVAALLTAAVAAPGGHPRLALGAAVAWLLLTGRFCARRLRRTARTPRHIAEMVVTSVLIPPLAIFWRIAGALRFRVFFF
jgi:GT2 family glycosyltransferase